MFGKVNKKSSGGGFGDVGSKTLPFTATDDGIGTLCIEPSSSSAVSYIYMGQYDEHGTQQDYAAIPAANSGLKAQQPFVMKKGWTYKNDASSNIKSYTLNVIPFK